MNRDPREIFPDVIVPATEFIVHDAVGQDLHLRAGNESIVLSKERMEMQNNPLLEELGLFDRAVIEKRTARVEAKENASAILPLIVAITKASREEAGNHLPSVFAAGKGRVITLDLALQEEAEE